MRKFRSEKVRDFSVIANLPPQNIEAEMAVLGAIMFDPGAIARVSEILKPEAFYVGAHQDIYRAALALYHSNKPVNILSVAEWLQGNNLLEQVGGKSKLAAIFDSVVSSANVDALAELVAEKYSRRQMIALGIKISQMAADAKREFKDCVTEMQEEVFRFGQSSAKKNAGLALASDTVPEFLQDIEMRYDSMLQPGLKTGFYGFDRMTGGLEAGQLMILAARPAMGKSALALDIAWHVATQEEKSVYFFSLEMSKKQIIRRKAVTLSRIPSTQIREARLSEKQWSALMEAGVAIAHSKLFLCDDSEIQVEDLKRSVMKAIAKYGESPGLIIIDYLQLLCGVAEDDSNQYQRVTKTSRQLKMLAGELDVPIIALSQLNRGVESRAIKRPQLSDLRDSGAIEQDADIICFLYRDEYYNPDTPDRGLAELIVAKQRDGETGTTKLLFDSQFASFKNLKL